MPVKCAGQRLGAAGYRYLGTVAVYEADGLGLKLFLIQNNFVPVWVGGNKQI